MGRDRLFPRRWSLSAFRALLPHRSLRYGAWLPERFYALSLGQRSSDDKTDSTPDPEQAVRGFDAIRVRGDRARCKRRQAGAWPALAPRGRDRRRRLLPGDRLHLGAGGPVRRVSSGDRARRRRGRSGRLGHSRLKYLLQRSHVPDGRTCMEDKYGKSQESGRRASALQGTPVAVCRGVSHPA